MADAQHDPNLKGNAAELAIAAEAGRLGLTVLKPLTEHERFDLVLGIGGQLLRTQCKWAPRYGDVIKVRTVGSRYSPSQGYVRTRYSPDEIDLIAAWCQDTRRCYLLPIEKFEGMTQIHLRLAPTRNGQRAALNFAADYELGAVAQPEERRRGTPEAAGSSPASSTPSNAVEQQVGTHLFRRRLGWYMERASLGERFLITRRGRPVARLLPPNGQVELSTASIRLPMKRR